MRIPFATNAYKLTSLPISAQQCINFYAEREPQDAKTDGQVAVLSVPGTQAYVTCGTGPIRGIRVMNDVAYVVSGPDLYSVDEFADVQFLGTGIDGSAVVSMSDNGTQVIIVNGTGGWIFSTNVGFHPIISGNFHAANTVTFFDDYFVLDRIGTNQWFFSNLLNGFVYNPLDFEAAEVQSDFVVGIVNQQENLLVFGEKSIETWYDTGAVDNPFQRYDGATIERGCIAPLTLLKEDNSVFFLGDDKIHYRLDGVSPRRISTHAIEAEWLTYPTLKDAFSFSYTFNGHKFINLIFPSGQKAWVFDISTNLWHERNSYNSLGNFYPLWRQNCVVPYLDRLLVGDSLSGRVDVITDSIYTEFDHPIIGTLTSPPIQKERLRVFMPLFELDIETGVGLTLGQGSDPQFMMDLSRDGGRTYGNLQQWMSMGKQGHYLQRLRWKKLGQARQFVLRITCSDPVPRRIIGAYGQVTFGM